MRLINWQIVARYSTTSNYSLDGTFDPVQDSFRSLYRADCSLEQHPTRFIETRTILDSPEQRAFFQEAGHHAAGNPDQSNDANYWIPKDRVVDRDTRKLGDPAPPRVLT